MRVRIHNGRLLCPTQGLDETGDLCLADGKIIATGKQPAGFSPELEIALNGEYICPGIIDLGVHTREPGAEHKASIASETAAATASGITIMVCTPDTRPVIDSSAVVELVHQRQQQSGKTQVLPLGALTSNLDGVRLTEVAALQRAGCVGLSNAGRPIVDTEVLRRAFEYAAGLAMPVFIHAQDSFLSNNGVLHEGRISARLGLPGIPATAETIAISRALLLAEQTGARVHFCRLSCARAVAMIEQAKQQGLPITADVGICHLYLTEQDVDGFNAQCHLTPPLRTEQDRDALRAGLQRGVIDALCSDHQPHDEDAKAAPFSLTEPGASTLEALAPLAFELVRESDCTPQRIVDALCRQPAGIINSEAGTLRPGSPADLFIFDPGQRWTLKASDMKSAGKNTPFDSRGMNGRVTHTFIGGGLVFKDG